MTTGSDLCGAAHQRESEIHEGDSDRDLQNWTRLDLSQALSPRFPTPPSLDIVASQQGSTMDYGSRNEP